MAAAAGERKALMEARKKEIAEWQQNQGVKLNDFRKRVEDLRKQLESVQKGLSELSGTAKETAGAKGGATTGALIGASVGAAAVETKGGVTKDSE